MASAIHHPHASGAWHVALRSGSALVVVAAVFAALAFTFNSNYFTDPARGQGVVGVIVNTPTPAEAAESDRLEALRPQSVAFSATGAGGLVVTGFGPTASNPVSPLDSDPATAWVAVNDGDWWQLDLGEVKNATAILAGGASGAALSATALESSSDGSSWSAISSSGQFRGRYLRFVLRGEGPAGLSDLRVTPL